MRPSLRAARKLVLQLHVGRICNPSVPGRTDCKSVLREFQRLFTCSASQCAFGGIVLGAVALALLSDPGSQASQTKAADHRAYVETIAGMTPAKFEMLPIPGGTFRMGSP